MAKMPDSSHSRRRTAVLISGRGSNMAALIAAAADPAYPSEIALVLSSRPNALGLDKARAAGIEAACADYGGGAAAAELEIEARLGEHDIDLICLAGFMRLLSPEFVQRWHDRMINIHPSLLPAFAGLNTHHRALDAGVKLHGCTVHFVRAAMDNGPIIAQAAVPVIEGDTPATLGARVLGAEHVLYPKVLALVAADRVRVVNELCVFSGRPPEGDGPGVLVSPPGI
jgi:phosphoribosylglycinamide formyltransferase-1